MPTRNTSPTRFHFQNPLVRTSETVALMERPEPAGLLPGGTIPPTCEHCTQLSGVIDSLKLEVERKNLELERVNRQKAELLDIAVHDLRLPVATIRIYSELLAEGIGAQTSSEIAEWVKSIRTLSNFVDHLLNETSDLANLESGSAHFHGKRLTLASIAENSVSMSQPLAARKQIRLAFAQYGEPRPVLLDPIKMTKVFNNLIENAIKYCHSGARVEVRVWRVEDRVMASVEDNGPGIEPTDLQTLFTPFQRTRARALSEEHSAGLGLAISKRMVQLHGGQISVKSEVGVGTTFFVSLPARFPETKKS